MIVTIAVGAGILIPFFDQMYEIPPPVTQIRTESPAAGEEEQAPAEPGTTAIAILQGAAVQGSPDYEPDPAQVPVGNTIVWDNQDAVPHTATSGTGPQDPESAQLFDTGIINGGEESTPVELQGASEGQTIPYYCIVHPYMTGELTVAAAEQGGGRRRARARLAGAHRLGPDEAVLLRQHRRIGLEARLADGLPQPRWQRVDHVRADLERSGRHPAFGRVTLLGDAAHPMYPVGGNGASQAILDARCLADPQLEQRRRWQFQHVPASSG